MDQTNDTTIFYFHGFASSPLSTKANIIKKNLNVKKFLIPDLNKPDFSHLNIQKIVEFATDFVLKNSSFNNLIIGSSLGGFVALLVSENLSLNHKLLLLAPALIINKINAPFMDKDVLKFFKENGFINVFHFAYKKTVKLYYDFILSMKPYADKFPPHNPDVETVIIHGINDSVVNIEFSKKFAKQNHLKLIAVNDDHELLKSIDIIVSQCRELLNRF